MIGLWCLAFGVLALDVLVIRWAQVEYRNYRARRAFQRVKEQLELYADLIGRAFLPAIQDAAYQIGEFARVLREQLGNTETPD